MCPWSPLLPNLPFLCLTHNVAVVSLGHEQHTANQICSGDSLSTFTFSAIRQAQSKTEALAQHPHICICLLHKEYPYESS